jgi:hypothetical protein
MPRFADIATGGIIANQNALVASTLPKLSSEVADNVFNNLPFFMWIRSKNRVKPWDTGESMEVPLMYGTNEYAGAYDDYELLDTGPPSGFGNAIFMRAKYRVPILYAATTLSANSGRAQIYNLIENLKMQAQKSLEKVMNDDLMRADGTNDNDSKRLTNIAYMIEDKTAQDHIVGGISKSTNEWWRNQYTGSSSSGDADVLDTLRTNVVACTDGNDAPDLGLCDSTSFLKIESLAFDKRRFVNAAAANLGFQNIVYNGVTYMFDKNLDDICMTSSVEGGITFHINSDHMYVAVCTDRNFQVIAPQYDVNQDCYLGAIIAHMQVIVDKMSCHGVVTGTQGYPG